MAVYALLHEKGPDDIVVVGVYSTEAKAVAAHRLTVNAWKGIAWVQECQLDSTKEIH